jgi:hypothetical protein
LADEELPGRLATVRPEGFDEHAAAVVPSKPANSTADAARRLDRRCGDRIADLPRLLPGELYALCGHITVSRRRSSALVVEDEYLVGQV